VLLEILTSDRSDRQAKLLQIGTAVFGRNDDFLDISAHGTRRRRGLRMGRPAAYRGQSERAKTQRMQFVIHVNLPLRRQ